jgi:hypothetical protein
MTAPSRSIRAAKRSNRGCGFAGWIVNTCGIRLDLRDRDDAGYIMYDNIYKNRYM